MELKNLGVSDVDRVGGYAIETNCGGVVAVALIREGRDTISPEDARKNASLFAAAPDMHATLLRIVTEYRANDLTIGAIEDAEAALAKAGVV